MRRSAGCRFGAFLLLCACGTTPHRPDPQQPPNLDASPHDPVGNYWCSIDDADRAELRCTIERTGETLRLIKHDGGERISGELHVEADELVFSGERSCTWEDCVGTLHGRFKPVGNGTYLGTFKEHPMVVRLVPMPEGAMVGSDGDGRDANGGVDTPPPVAP